MTKPKTYSPPMPSRRRRGCTRHLIYDYINDYYTSFGFPPTVREIAAAVGISSTGTIYAHLRSLEKDKLIERDTKRARAIRTHKM